MPGMQTVVSEKHVKVYNKQALNNLPKHLHGAHKKHAESKGDGEVVSLPLFTSLFGNKETQKVEGGLVGNMLGVVTGIVTGRPVQAVQSGISFFSNTVKGVQHLKQYDDYMKNKSAINRSRLQQLISTPRNVKVLPKTTPKLIIRKPVVRPKTFKPNGMSKR